MPNHLQLIRLLARSELSRRYSGRILGPLWAFALPLLTIFVIWFALVYGLRMKELSGGYSLDLVVGLMAWLFFADAISASASSLTSNTHLVKKVVFPIVLLPISQVAASFFVHACVVFATCVAFALFGALNFSTLPILLFWMLAFWGLTTAIAILVAGFAVIIKDVAEIVPAVLQVMFWSTPIIWPVTAIAPSWLPLFMSNPLAIIVQGYRLSILGTDLGVGLAAVGIFSIATVLLFGFALIVFRRIKVIFAEEL